MNLDQDSKLLFNSYLIDYKREFTGWDFSFIEQTHRMATEPLNWSYTSKILPYLRQAKTFLDMGTGGGEFLELLTPLPEKTFATEMYEQNVPIATERLRKYSVEVRIPEDDQHLPFEDKYFDLVINKHENYDATEVYRILKSGSYFITQQVGDKNFIDMNQIFGYNDPDTEAWNVEFASHLLEKVGLEITYKNSDKPISRFYDLGAVLYYLKAIPWQIPDFNVKKYYDTLLLIFERLKDHEYIEFTEDRFIIIAKKL